MSFKDFGEHHCSFKKTNKRKDFCPQPVALAGTGGETEAWFPGRIDAKSHGTTYIKPITSDASGLCYYHRKLHKLAKLKVKY